MKRIAVTTLVALAIAAPAGAKSEKQWKSQEREQVRAVESAKTTIRFFGNHPTLLRQRRTMYQAWRALLAAQSRATVGRNAIRWIRSLSATRPIPHLRQWLCIHQGEGSWTDPGAPFYGGLQMDLGFQLAYGLDFYRAKGTADHWTPYEQMLVAERAFPTRGFYPWPNTARRCGLI